MLLERSRLKGLQVTMSIGSQHHCFLQLCWPVWCWWWWLSPNLRPCLYKSKSHFWRLETMRLFKFADELKIDFVKGRYLAFVVTGIMVLGSVGLLWPKRLKLRDRFSGGIMMETKHPYYRICPRCVLIWTGLGLGNISIQGIRDRSRCFNPCSWASGWRRRSKNMRSNRSRLRSMPNTLKLMAWLNIAEWICVSQVGDERKTRNVGVLLTAAGILDISGIGLNGNGVAAILTLVHDIQRLWSGCFLCYGWILILELWRLCCWWLVIQPMIWLLYLTVFVKTDVSSRKCRCVMLSICPWTRLYATLNTSFTTLLSSARCGCFMVKWSAILSMRWFSDCCRNIFIDLCCVIFCWLYFPFEDPKKRGCSWWWWRWWYSEESVPA